MSEIQKPEEERQLLKAGDFFGSGCGCCVLGHPRIAEIAASALRKFDDGTRSACSHGGVMPNHVHVVFQPERR